MTRDMTATWLVARTLELESTAQPGILVDVDGTANSTAAILLGDDGKGVIIEGRPADLVQLCERMLEQARSIEVATMVNPELLRLYGGTEPTHAWPEPSVFHEEMDRQRLEDTYFERPNDGGI